MVWKKLSPMMKFAVIAIASLVGGMTFVAILFGGSAKSPSNTSTHFINDSATNDTPVETLKTLTAHISTVEQQNQKLVEANKTLIEQDKTTLAQFKTDMAAQIHQQMDVLKAEQATIQPALPAHDQSEVIDSKKLDDKGNPINTNETGFVWVADLQQSNNMNSNLNSNMKDKSATELATLLNPSLAQKSERKTSAAMRVIGSHNNAIDAELNNETFHEENYKEQDSKIHQIPYYTIPVNATLTGAIAMQPLIGRIPIDGKVQDPYTFKAIIGPKNLAANGIDIPSDIQGIVVSGIAEGDLLGGCTRGDITSMTFVFADGRISTTEAKNSQALGTVAAANGNPCLAGSFHSDAALYLGATAGLAGLQGYGNALSQSQLSTTTSPTTGTAISTLIGNANRFAFGQGVSASSQAAQTWWNQRVRNSFDFIYVPNVDPTTGKKLELNINITQEIPIDYNPRGRKVFYAHETNPYTTDKLD